MIRKDRNFCDQILQTAKKVEKLHLNYFQFYPITARCCSSIPPENIRNPLGFLMFSGGLEKQHRAVMS